MPSKRNPEPAEELEPKGFEESLRTAEALVASLESGTLDLDEALAVYEKGVKLLERCHAKLDAAEQKVAILTGTNADGSPKIEAFQNPAES